MRVLLDKKKSSVLEPIYFKLAERGFRPWVDVCRMLLTTPRPSPMYISLSILLWKFDRASSVKVGYISVPRLIVFHNTIQNICDLWPSFNKLCLFFWPFFLLLTSTYCTNRLWINHNLKHFYIYFLDHLGQGNKSYLYIGLKLLGNWLICTISFVNWLQNCL